MSTSWRRSRILVRGRGGEIRLLSPLIRQGFPLEVHKYCSTELNESSLATERNSVSLTLSRRRKYLPTTQCGWHAAHCITAKYLFFTTWLTVSSPSSAGSSAAGVLIAPLRIRLAIPQMPVEGRRPPSLLLLAARGGGGVVFAP